MKFVPCTSSPRSFIYQAFLLVVAGLFSCLAVQAQEYSQYDRGTPPQHAAGISSFGSYTSADIGSVNLANGGLNFRLPLGGVGGRGFSIPITLNYSSKVWSASRGEDVDNGHHPFPQAEKVVYASYAQADWSDDLYNRLAPGWTIGAQPMLRARMIGIGSSPTSCVGAYRLTKLTLVLPDRGEIELRDDETNGAPILVPQNQGCGYRDGYRGSRWHAADGSGLIFISDNANGPVAGYLAGTVITADGMRYRFEDDVTPYVGLGLARCHSITDRNGNQITISYAGSEVQYTDPLGRVTKIQRNVPDPANSAVNIDVLVTLAGYTGQPRYYKIKFGIMHDHYRGTSPTLPVGTGLQDSDIAPHGYGSGAMGTALFLHSWGKYVQYIDQESVVSDLILPDDRSLQFKYNEYGEVAEVQLPTGGKIQYDYGSTVMPSGNSASWEKSATGGSIGSSILDIDRALLTRRTYPDGMTLESTWIYSYGITSTETKAYAGTTSGQLLLDQKHYFLTAGRYVYLNLKDTDGTGYSLWSTGIERRTETLDANGAILSASEQDWTQRTPLSWSTGYTQEQPANDNRVNEERSILETGQTSRRTFVYDQFNNPLETSEFDFDNTLKRRTQTSYSATSLVNGVNYASDSVHLLRLPLQQSVYDVNTEQARTIYEYDIYTGTHHEPLKLYDPVTGHDTTYGAGRTARGNATRVARWIKTTGGYLFAYPRYDILGNVVSLEDAKGYVTTIDFTDDFGLGSNPGTHTQGLHGATYALPTQVTSPAPNIGEQPHTSQSQYDYSTGSLTGFRDRNGFVTQTFYDDPLDRPTLTKSALGITGVENQKRMYYAPATVFGVTLTRNDVLTAQDQINVGDANLRSWIHTDGFGRTIETWSRDPQGDVEVSTIYDALGRVRNQSNPFRQGESAIYSTTVYDFAGRARSITTPDSATVTTDYNGNQVLVKDQMGKERMTQTNALGQLTDAWEITAADDSTESVTFPNHSEVVAGYRSKYSYDTLGNLITIKQQKGTAGTLQTRSFAYNSLSQLTDATNPESGHVVYDYDPNGNLLHKTDARLITTTYDYDALNRNKTVDYSNTTASPDITRLYDGATNGKGRLQQSYFGGTESVGATVEHTKILSYDALGRPQEQRQRFKTNSVWSDEYKTLRTYNLAGATVNQTYPSGNTVSYIYDTAGRITSFTGNLGGGAPLPYSTEITYSPLGGMTKEKFGTDTAIYNKLFYNSRGQLAEIREGTSYTGPNDTGWERGAIINYYSGCWGMCGGSNSTTPMTDNNGNLKKQEIFIPGASSWLQQYDYDDLNRLRSVAESSGSSTVWRQEYFYDRFGNRRLEQDPAKTYGAGINKQNFELEPATNRLLASGDSALIGANLPQRKMRYDDAGNLTNDSWSSYGSSTPGAITRTFDAENRMTSALDSSSGTSYYNYNAEGQRVRRRTGSVETWQVYGMDGELLGEYAASGAVISPQKEYGYRNGQLLITAEPGSGTVPSVGNSGFEAPVVGGGNFQYGPAGGTWTFAGGTGVSGNGSAFTGANPAAPAGIQVAFVQGGNTSVMSQAVSGFESGKNYSVQFKAAQRAGAGGQDFDVYLDTTLLGTFTPPSNSYTTMATASFTTTAGTHTLKFVGRDTAGGDRTAFVDEVALTIAAGTATFVTGKTLGSLRSDSPGWTGFEMTVGGQAVTVTSLGRYCAAGNSLTHELRVIRSSDNVMVASVNVAMSGCSAGQTKYATLATPVTLAASTTYRLVSYEVGSDNFHDWTGVVLTTTAVATVLHGSYTTDGGLTWGPAGGTGSSYVPVDFQYSTGSGGGTAGAINWLVTDQLGTPRMMFDKTGALATTKRHDYLPFGEELFAGTGGRTIGLGYSGDSVRQKFTQKERDSETGLDYFGARYYASTQGRFTSADPLMSSGTIYNPQSWNRYSYTSNNPLRFVDPTGMWDWDASAGGSDTDEQLKAKRSDKSLTKKERNAAKDALKYRQRFRDALAGATVLAQSGRLDSSQQGEVSRAVNSYGTEGDGNKVF